MNAAPQKLFSAGQISACRDQTWHQQEDRDPLLRRKKMGSILLFQSGPADESGARAHVHTRKHTHLFHLLWVQMIASHLCSQHHSSLLFSSVVAPFLSLSLSLLSVLYRSLISDLFPQVNQSSQLDHANPSLQTCWRTQNTNSLFLLWDSNSIKY